VAVWPKPALPVWRTGLTGLGSQGAGCFKAEDTRRDRKACVEATRSAVAGHSSDGATKTNYQCALCRMDLPGPTSSVGTRTDYSVGPWDYPACATRHLME
jgi:tRNA(Ile2) C34 agmatinyltransferase TiaS